uniref:Mitochondrial fission factor n=1 Tax=Scapholeberis mucronata TaxID=202097 RepID=A0A4Y7NM66_9CRUS|nr:EOG090X08OG [Scapholeberis mucronata]SVE93704.1 EOG090X08OG [Scapholeberis mucronata]
MGSNGYNSSSDDMYENSSFAADMSTKMQVPKRIRVLGGADHEDKVGTGNFNDRYSIKESKYDMTVPERILVVGQDQHIGMKAPPHELVLENSILTMSNSFPPIRVRTPPRSITIDTASDNIEQDHFESDNENNQSDTDETTNLEAMLVSDKSNLSATAEPPQLTLNASQLTEEVFVLRQQIGRLHRRMAGFEREQQQRQQRDALVVSIGAVYFVWKVILWLTRSS